jgi:hypothetical protein
LRKSSNAKALRFPRRRPSAKQRPPNYGWGYLKMIKHMMMCGAGAFALAAVAVPALAAD